MEVLLLTALLFVRGTTAAHELYEGDLCSHDGSKCERLTNCPLAHEDLHKGKKPPLCGFDKSEPIVCCTDDLADRFGESTKTISAHMCTKYEEESCKKEKSSSNNENQYEELAFMGLIGYGRKANISWLCTGTLVSRRYILSAAHCAKTKRGDASWVMLGHGSPEGPTLYTIVVYFLHPDYRPPALYNDIALYRLDRVVEFGQHVKPICLPQGDITGMLDESNAVISSGWTLDKNKAPEKSSDKIRLVPTFRCGLAGSAEELPTGVRDNIICTSQLAPGASCQRADYGGVLISPITPASSSCYLDVQLGVLSVGRHCGVAEYPGVYLNVTHFQPWVESVVWPENSSYTEIIWNN